MSDFKGKVALLTGAAKGIGQATAMLFARRGADVVVCDVLADAGKETVAMIEGLGRRALYVHTDVTDSTSIQRAVSIAVETFGRLDYAFNNAGVRTVAPVAELDESEWRRVIEVNLTGVYLCMKYELPEILKTKGAIVNMSSVLGLTGSVNRSAYVASKHGVIGLTKTAALEYGEAGIRINAVAPGVTETQGMVALAPGALLEQSLSRTAVKRSGQPAEIGEAVAWLCSDAASYVNGIVMPVDGGFLA